MAVNTQRCILTLIGPACDGPGLDRCGDQGPGLVAVNAVQLFQFKRFGGWAVRPLGFDIQRLTAHHTSGTYGHCDIMDNPQAVFRPDGVVGQGGGQQFKGQAEQAVAG